MAMNEAVAGWDEGPPPTYALPVRIWRNLAYFARRKPIGAFGGVLVLIPVFACIFGPGVAIGPVSIPGFSPYGYDEYTMGQSILESPSSSHLMGTDHIGRDLFSRLLYGMRLSFFIGGGAFLISTVMSTVLTLISAYYLDTVDLFLQRAIEIVGFLPDLILLIALFSIYGATPTTMLVTLGVLGGVTTGRVLRSVVIGLRGMPYIDAAQALGGRDRHIIMRHILPNVAYLIIIISTGVIATAIVVESALAILGFGISPDYPTLGNLLNGSRSYLRAAPHLAVFPGIMIFMILLGSRLLGDALRDVLDPRLRGSR